MIDYCALCGLKKELQNSHFMPKFLYRELKKPFPANYGGVLLVDDDKAFYVGKEIKKYLLCADCEHKFSQNGEDSVAREIMTQNNFPLLEKLRPLKEKYLIEPCFHVKELQPIPLINCNAFFYFALSIIWRATITDWSFGDTSVTGKIRSQDQANIALFLRSSCNSVVSNIAVHVSACNDNPPAFFTPPNFTENPDNSYAYKFFIQGIRFVVLMGTTVHNEQIIFSEYPFYKTSDAKTVFDFSKNSVPKGRLLKEIETGFFS